MCIRDSFSQGYSLQLFLFDSGQEFLRAGSDSPRHFGELVLEPGHFVPHLATDIDGNLFLHALRPQHGSESVSYTHLDVYKRQTLG